MQLHSNILGKGQPFIILHGFLGMSDNWKTLGAEFSKQGFNVHLIDQRNHGRSSHNEVFNYKVLVDDLYQYCKNHKFENIVLLGHSMGGKVAMLFASEYPELVSRLIVADISPRFYPIRHETILKGLSALNFDELKSRGQADEILENYVSDYRIRLFLLKNLYWKEKGRLALRINLEILIKNVSEVGEALPAYSKFNGQTLFLKGDESDYLSQKDVDLIQTHFPRAIIKTIYNAGHWLHAENPKDFFDVVMRFVS